MRKDKKKIEKKKDKKRERKIERKRKEKGKHVMLVLKLDYSYVKMSSVRAKHERERDDNLSEPGWCSELSFV